MKPLFIIFTVLFSLSVFANEHISSAITSEEIIFSTEYKRSVVDLYTDPSSKVWEKYPPVHELCYKNADSQQALEEILKLKDEGILFHDYETEDFQDAEIDEDTIRITVYNGKLLDNGIEDDEAYEQHDIGPCEF